MSERCIRPQVSSVSVLQTNQLPSPGEPAVAPEPTPFFSPKKQKTAEGHVVRTQHTLLPVVMPMLKICVGQ